MTLTAGGRGVDADGDGNPKPCAGYFPIRSRHHRELGSAKRAMTIEAVRVAVYRSGAVVAGDFEKPAPTSAADGRRAVA